MDCIVTLLKTSPLIVMAHPQNIIQYFIINKELNSIKINIIHKKIKYVTITYNKDNVL